MRDREFISEETFSKSQIFCLSLRHVYRVSTELFKFLLAEEIKISLFFISGVSFIWLLKSISLLYNIFFWMNWMKTVGTSKKMFGKSLISL